MARILIVDDDPHIRELVRHFVELEGMEVVEATDGADALQLLETIVVDLAVIDIMMPHMNGWDLCQQLRKQSTFPLLMLTAKSETSQIVKGFNLGADDYLVKPFDPLVLMARIKALLKRYNIITSQTIQLGDVTLRRHTFQCWVTGVEMTLPLKEFELLFKLASYPGQTFPRDQLIKQIWGGQSKDDGGITTGIYFECVT